MRYLILLLLVGCAAMTEDEKIDREYAYAELVSEYLESKAECKMAGGVWITRRWLVGCGLPDTPREGTTSLSHMSCGRLIVLQEPILGCDY
jgi:hypothetical protein